VLPYTNKSESLVRRYTANMQAGRDQLGPFAACYKRTFTANLI